MYTRTSAGNIIKPKKYVYIFGKFTLLLCILLEVLPLSALAKEKSTNGLRIMTTEMGEEMRVQGNCFNLHFTLRNEDYSF